MKGHKSKAKATRETRRKQIVALAKHKHIARALQVAKGWPLEEDAAHRLVDRWQAIEAQEKGDPKFFKDHGPAICSRLRHDTAELVGRAILSGDVAFFLRMVKRMQTEPAKPERDEMRIAVLLDRVEALSHRRPEKDAKTIAFDLGSKNTISAAEQVRRFRRQIRKDK